VHGPLTSGPRGWPADQTPCPAGPPLQPLIGWLQGDTLQETVEGNPKLKVSGGRTPWRASHLARPAGHDLACYRLNQVGNPPWTPINTPIPVEIKATHTTSIPPLVKVQFSSSSTGKALSRVES
jgi:hypothetical protein